MGRTVRLGERKEQKGVSLLVRAEYEVTRLIKAEGSCMFVPCLPRVAVSFLSWKPAVIVLV